MSKKNVHETALNRLYALITAIENYQPGLVGACRTLHEALKGVEVPTGLRFDGTAQWAKAEIASVQRTLHFEALVACAKARLKTADAALVLAQREVLKARKELELCGA